MSETDATIWLKFVEGDKSAFEKLMHVHYKDLFNYGTKFSHDTELVKDCIQDLFLNLWSKRKTITLPVNVRAYLFASLRRGLLRKMGKAQLVSEFKEDISNFNFQVSIEQQFITKESSLLLAQRVAAQMESLPSRQKEVILLQFFQGLNRDEIAEIMDIRPQTVSNLLQLALKKLRTSFRHRSGEYAIYIILTLMGNIFL